MPQDGAERGRVDWLCLFLVLPPEARKWARQNGLPQPPDSPAAGASAGGGAVPGLQIVSPDPNTIYHLTPRLPRESQQIPLRVITGLPVISVTFVLDGRPLVALEEGTWEVWWILEPGSHTLQAAGTLEGGEVVRSEPLTFSVLP